MAWAHVEYVCLFESPTQNVSPLRHARIRILNGISDIYREQNYWCHLLGCECVLCPCRENSDSVSGATLAARFYWTPTLWIDKNRKRGVTSHERHVRPPTSSRGIVPAPASILVISLLDPFTSLNALWLSAANKWTPTKSNPIFDVLDGSASLLRLEMKEKRYGERGIMTFVVRYRSFCSNCLDLRNSGESCMDDIECQHIRCCSVRWQYANRLLIISTVPVAVSMRGIHLADVH